MADRIGSTPPAPADLTELGEQTATKWERAVIFALQELGREWPESVTLQSSCRTCASSTGRPNW
jgi:hypothetical protein